MRPSFLALLVAIGVQFPSVVAGEGNSPHITATGVVQAVDPTALEITITYEMIGAINWPTDTADFVVRPGTDLNGIEPGSEVEFIMEKNATGNYEIFRFAPAPERLDGHDHSH